jgi:hypothetical protein
LAHICYYFVVANLGALAASSVTYISPVVALVIGVFLVDDVINPPGYVAMMFILSGVAVLQLGSRRTKKTLAARAIDACGQIRSEVLHQASEPRIKISGAENDGGARNRATSR